MTISILQAHRMIDELRDYEVSLGRDPKTWYTYENHVYGVAKIAKKIAEKIKTMNPDQLYVMGLLHDICRTQDERAQRFHGILGYEKMVGIDKDVARICLLHTFPWDKLPAYDTCEKLFYHRFEDYEFTANFIAQNTPRDEDYLIQLCDNLANKNGFVTIEERAAEIFERRRWLDGGITDVEHLNEIKKYFDQKIGCNIYDLFDLLRE